MAITTPKYSGQVGSVSGTSLTVKSGTTPSNDWVGRLIYLTSGNGKFQWREVTAVSGQDLTLKHAFNDSPLVGYTEVNPAADDNFSISHNVDDIVASESYITKVANRHYKINSSNGNRFTISGNSIVHIKSCLLDFGVQFTDVRVGSALILGNYEYIANSGKDCSPKETVQALAINDNEARGIGFERTTSGNFEMYGGGWVAQNTYNANKTFFFIPLTKTTEQMVQEQDL